MRNEAGLWKTRGDAPSVLATAAPRPSCGPPWCARGVLGGPHRGGAQGFRGRGPTINASIALDTAEALETAERLDRLRRGFRNASIADPESQQRVKMSRATHFVGMAGLPQ